MGVEYLLSLAVRCLGIAVVHADHVGREASVVVYVGLAVGHGADVHVRAEVVAAVGLDQTQQKLIARRVVVGGTLDGDAVLGNVCKAYTEIVCLHLVVTAAFGGKRAVRDAP